MNFNAMKKRSRRY